MDTHDSNLYVFNYSGVDDDKKSIFKKYPFYTTCDMNTLYFDNKDEILEKICFFRDNKRWYENKSKPYTLGICTYGLPGCGKTSFEKALAKMLERHIIIVDISKFKTKDEADNVFFSEKINDRIIPYEKRLYVFPDFDCQSKITKERELSFDFTNKDKKNKEDKVIIINNDKISEELIEKEDKMNLSKLLNIFDGIPERTGQIMVFNTNYIKHLDSALLRPGRMDMILKFDKISQKNALKMMENHYSENIESKNKKIPDRQFTPAEMFKILSSYKTSESAFNDISNWNKIIENNYDI
jgi:ATP-dependent Lon protease